MRGATFIGRASATVLVVALAAGCGPLGWGADDAEAGSTGSIQSIPTAADAHPSFLHGRITTVDGERYEGRLRFGGDEEAFWGDYFNGFKDGNPWIDLVPPGALSAEGRTIRFLGFDIRYPAARKDLRRQLMVRFGDIARIEARGRDLRVTLKGGTVVRLDRYAADDFADGLRVWDARRGVVDLDERRIRSVEFLPPTRWSAASPHRLHGTVRTRQGDRFTGHLQWNRRGSVALDELTGHGADGEQLRFSYVAIRAIARHSPESAQVTLLDGREILLSGTRDVGQGHGGIYVDDPRYGRVLISWDAFDRVDFGPVDAGSGGGGPAYDDFPPGRPITGSVITSAGRRLSGRLVFDLDESEITQTLDAPSGGVHYTIPFGLVASIALPGRDGRAAGRATVTLRSGEMLQLERSDDLGDGNAGMLIFGGGHERPEYVPWMDVERVDFGRPLAVYPPIDEH